MPVDGRLSKQALTSLREEIFTRRREAALHPTDVSKENGPNPLWIIVNKYAPIASLASKSQGTGNVKEPITLILAHANGFSKEVS